MGCERSEFWSLTPREIGQAFEARTRKLTTEHNERAWLAWHIAGLSRAKRLPNLQKMMIKSKQPRRIQPWQEQMQIMDMWVHATRHLQPSQKSKAVN